ncbi:MAG: hypothetical protein AB7F40_04935 [Victivallaceae bacterium]
MRVAKRHMPTTMPGIGAASRKAGRMRLPFAVCMLIFAASFLAYFLLSPGDFQVETVFRCAESSGISRRAEEPTVTAARVAGETMLAEERFDVEAVMLQLLKEYPSRNFENDKLLVLLFTVCLAALLAGLFRRNSARRTPSVVFHFQCILKGSFPVRAGPQFC